MHTNIEIIGANGDKRPYTDEDVRRLLASREIGLSYGADFMGRPVTKVYSGEDKVVKLRSELSLKEDVGRRWCLHALERERRFAVHHPWKTWFLAEREVSDEVSIGNICPRLRPLHSLLQSKPASRQQREERLQWLADMLEMEFRLNAEAATRLDLGLSNFALGADGQLYYLDDDFYPFDQWVSLALMLGVYLRTYAWIDEAFATELGKIVHGLMPKFFLDPHCLSVLAEQMRGLFMPNEDKRSILFALVEQLTARPRKLKQPSVLERPAIRQRYFAVLADVHANLPALEAALAFLEKEDIHQGIILGDIVGYGPHPVECIERLQDGKLDLAAIRGNHDHAAATGLIGQGFGSTARWVIEWTIPRLNEEHKAWLLELPLFLAGEEWLAVHGAPVDPGFFNAYVYHMTYAQNLDVLEQREIRYCFHGHTHMQGVYVRKPPLEDALVQETCVALADVRHCLICPGSIGQPRNREAGAQLAVLDWESRQIKFFNLPYALEKTVQDMEQAGFPPGLSKRLLAGL